MELATKPFLSGKRASVSEAKLAYFEGDFERCLAICNETRVRSVATASEVALLSARAYLRTGRPHEAEAAVVETRDTHATLDASLTAQMLIGSARIRQGDPDTGLAMLDAAAARSAGAHLAVRSEIAFSTALGHWAKRDIDAAEKYLVRVDRRSDIIHARALELTAWCQMARGNYRRAGEFFILTLLRLDDCLAQDRAIAATAISTLSIIAAELFDGEIARVAELRAETMQWTSGLTMQHYLTLLHQALFAEIAGNTVEAYDRAMQAREIAPTVPFAAYSWSVSSCIARNAGEPCVAAVYAQRAGEILATVDLRELVGEERSAILGVAESWAQLEPQRAEALFSAYWGLAPVDKMLVLSGDPCMAAEETFVAGVIAAARGDVPAAQRCYTDAFATFERIGYVRRAVFAALALVKLGDRGAMQDYIVQQLRGTSNCVTRYLDDRCALAGRRPGVVALTGAQREVVALVCQGKTNKEIAVVRKVGEQTIKNMLTKHIFRAYGVSSRTALVSRCLRDASEFTSA